MLRSDLTASRKWSDNLWLVGCCAFTSMASMRICDAMLPALATQFGATPGQSAQAISAFALAYGILQLFYGPLGDRYGKVKVIGCATLACTVGSGVAAVVLSAGFFFGARPEHRAMYLVSYALRLVAGGVGGVVSRWRFDSPRVHGRQVNEIAHGGQS